MKKKKPKFKNYIKEKKNLLKLPLEENNKNKEENKKLKN